MTDILIHPPDWSPVDTHRCPKCELIFATRTELEAHLAEEHPGEVVAPPK